MILNTRNAKVKQREANIPKLREIQDFNFLMKTAYKTTVIVTSKTANLLQRVLLLTYDDSITAPTI